MPVKMFKTSVKNEELADLLILYLQKTIPDFLIHFDLTDEDHILRLNGNREVSGLVVQILKNQGVDCQPI